MELQVPRLRRLPLGTAHLIQKKVYGLKDLMDEAIKQGLLRDEDLEHHQYVTQKREEFQDAAEAGARDLGWPAPDPLPVEGPQDFCKMLAKYFPRHRTNTRMEARR